MLLTAGVTALPTEATVTATAVTLAAVPTLLSGPLINEVNDWSNHRDKILYLSFIAQLSIF